jgi:GxxExxY protein
MKFDALSNHLIGCAIEVHRHLGPGLLQSVYEQCLATELTGMGIPYQSQLELPVKYKGKIIDCGYRIDILVDNSIIVELKSTEKLVPIHDAQILTYMKMSNIKTGLLINFNVPVLKDGIKRFVL